MAEVTKLIHKYLRHDKKFPHVWCPGCGIGIMLGEGAPVASGGNDFMHAARRNIDLTAIIVNNSVYGMTGGQYSPTTPYGMKSTTTTYSNIEQDFKISELAVTAGAVFVGRGEGLCCNIL